MFSFLEEIEKKTGIPFDLLSNGFRVINFCNKSIYIEGFKDILLFSTDAVSIKLKRGVLEVHGKDLKLKNLNVSSLFVNGNIESISIN